MLAAAAGREFTIPYGGTSQFQYAPDVARAFVQAALAEYDGASVHNLAGQAVSMEGVGCDDRGRRAGGRRPDQLRRPTLPFPEAVDVASLTEVIGPVFPKKKFRVFDAVRLHPTSDLGLDAGSASALRAIRTGC